MQTHKVIEALNRMTAERGEKKGQFYHASFSCKEVLDYMGADVTQGHLRHVAYIVEKGYPESRIDGGTRKTGRILYMKIRSV